MNNTDDILKRILLNMKYDSSMTLSENYSYIIVEQEKKSNQKPNEWKFPDIERFGKPIEGQWNPDSGCPPNMIPVTDPATLKYLNTDYSKKLDTKLSLIGSQASSTIGT
jgi:hypothetical protein